MEGNTPIENEPKFLVFYSMLVSLFLLFCFRCKTGKPRVAMKQTGTMVTVLQHCSHCGGNPYTWRSQPYLLLGMSACWCIFKSYLCSAIWAMELEGAKRCFTFLQHVGLSVATFVSDCHRGIAKCVRQFQPQTSHFLTSGMWLDQ